MNTLMALLTVVERLDKLLVTSGKLLPIHWDIPVCYWRIQCGHSCPGVSDCWSSYRSGIHLILWHVMNTAGTLSFNPRQAILSSVCSHLQRWSDWPGTALSPSLSGPRQRGAGQCCPPPVRAVKCQQSQSVPAPPSAWSAWCKSTRWEEPETRTE